MDCWCIICGRQHTLSQFPRNPCSSLYFLRSCNHQSLDSLQYPIGWSLYDLQECRECGASWILTQGVSLCVSLLSIFKRAFYNFSQLVFISTQVFLLVISISSQVYAPTLNKVIIIIIIIIIKIIIIIIINNC